MKTRLARAVGDAEAVAIYRRLVGAVFGVLGRLEGVRLRVLFDPPGRAREIEAWVSELLGAVGGPEAEFAAQAAGDLGARLREGFATAFSDGFEAVAAVGTDCVDVSADTLTRAWSLLSKGGVDVVLGPSEDGGYYLVAMQRLHEALFDGIPWSSGDTLEATVAAAKGAGLETALLETLRDVDKVADWQAVVGRMRDE